MLDVLIEERLKKLRKYREFFGMAYPARTERGVQAAAILKSFDDYDGRNVCMMGRVLGVRGQGGIVFLDVWDGVKFQFVLSDNKTDRFADIQDLIDTGDFVEAKGILGQTKRGEKSLFAEKIRIVSKCLRPWPSSWYGVEDVEERQRRRYLDLIFHEEAREKILFRSRMTSEFRKVLEGDGFLEVETPVLQPIPGGAIARPFETHFNALDLDVYLRIAPELYLKRLLVAGFPKIFEIARDFRNEGIDRDHYPEFTMLELYAAYWDYEEMMGAVEGWLKTLSESLGLEKLSFRGQEIKNFYKEWPRVDYAEIIKKHSGKDLKDLKVDEVDEVFKKKVRPNIIEPTFVVNYPKAISPLSKSSDNNPEMTERFQLVVAGTELVNGFSELNDPVDQRERMEEQEKRFRAGDEEASRMDEDFLEALEYGMPPAAGIGIGIDRLAALFTDSHSIREVIAFTNLRPKIRD